MTIKILSFLPSKTEQPKGMSALTAWYQCRRGKTTLMVQNTPKDGGDMSSHWCLVFTCLIFVITLWKVKLSRTDTEIYNISTNWIRHKALMHTDLILCSILTRLDDCGKLSDYHSLVFLFLSILFSHSLSLYRIRWMWVWKNKCRHSVAQAIQQHLLGHFRQWPCKPWQQGSESVWKDTEE